MHSAHDPYAALRSPNYRFLLGGNLLAGIASEMQSVAVGWEMYQRTHSKAALGLVGLVQFLPLILLALPAGHAADRYSRKGLLLLSQAVLFLASSSLAVLSCWEGEEPVPFIYVCVLLIGVSQALRMPARSALVSTVVPRPVLANAMTWNSSGYQIASVMGPALGGLVIGAADGRATPAYILAALGTLGCASLVARIRPQPQERPTEAPSLRSLLAGVRFVWRTKPILATITLDLFAVLLGGATALLPVYASEESLLNVGPSGLGWLRAAPALGALVMALLLAHRRPLRRPGLTLVVAVVGFGVATVIFGLSTSMPLSLAMLALTGACDNISVVVRGTLVQLLTPDAMRGRVSAVNAIFIGSSNQLGEAESGLTAAWFGPVASVVSGGIGTVLVVVVVTLTWPQILRLGPLQQPLVESVPPGDELSAEENETLAGT